MTDFHLLIDDLRVLVGMNYTARTPNEGLEILKQGHVTHLYLDNDLGLGVIEGWEVLNTAIQENVAPPYIQLVTSNPVARKRMQDVLKDNNYVSRNGGLTWKLLVN